jgi:ABC-type transport system involved in multi-copper enzyme maturation permease subunit
MRILAIARNTVREAVRERLMLVLGLFGFALLLGSQALSPLALGEGRKVVIDFGLAGSMLLATLLSVFLGASLLHKELERKTLYSILAKPVRREEFVLGKFFGLWFTTAALLAAMAGILASVVTVAYGRTPWTIAGATALSVIELGIVTAVVVLFSSFTTPALTAFFGIAAVVVGHFAEDLRYFAAHGAPLLVRAMTEAVYWALPHLSVFNARGLAVHDIAVEPERMLFAIGYGGLYIAALMIFAGTIFRRREFK